MTAQQQQASQAWRRVRLLALVPALDQLASLALRVPLASVGAAQI